MPSDTRIFPNACFKPENFNQAGPIYAGELANEFFLNHKLKVFAERGTYYYKEPKVKYCQCKEKEFVHPFYARELESEADFNEEIRSEPDLYSTEYRYEYDHRYDDEVYLCKGMFVKARDHDIIYEDEIYDENEEDNWKNEDDAPYEVKNLEIEDDSQKSTSEYIELRKRISPEQRSKHFWPKRHIEKQIEWNSKLTKALEQHWPDSFNKSIAQITCPIVIMEGHQPYNIVTKMIPYLNKNARKRIASIQKEARFVEKVPRKHLCCPKCGHTNDPNLIPCCNLDKRMDGSQCFHWTIKRGAVHSVIPSTKIIVAFFKNKKGKRGIVLDPLVIQKHFKSYEERYKNKYLRFDGRQIRSHSAYTYFNTTGPIHGHEKSPEENYIELHDGNKNVLI